MRLIDADKLKMTTMTRWNGDVDFVVYKEELDNAPTVIAEKQTDGDLISRQAVIDIVKFECREWKGLAKTIVKGIEQLPSTEKTIQTYGWCKGCKEYDTEKHCCHRYSSFIRESLQDSINAVLEDIKTEIDDLERFYDNDRFSTNGEPMFKVYEVLEIIDNHISGKEE